MLKRKKKVLFLIHTLGAGGAEKVLVDTVNSMTGKYDVTLMTVIDTGINKSKLNNNVDYKTMFKTKNKDTNVSLLSNKKSFLKTIFIKIYMLIWKLMPIKLLRFLKIKDTYDIEISFLEGISAKVVSKSNAKKIVWIHVDLINEPKADKVFISKNAMFNCYNNFNKIVCVSEVVKNQFIKKFDSKIDSKKITVLYNSIDSNSIIKKSTEITNCYSNKKIVNMVSIGRLAPQKGYDRLINNLSKLKNEGYKFNMNIIGIGPLFEELNNKVNKLNLSDCITFLGFKQNPFPYLKEADFFVCSSLAEGFSTVVCEASIIGLPTITTDCSGMKELFGDNKYGYIVNNDENSLYKGIKYFLDNKDIVLNYKNKLPELSQRFDLKKSIDKVEGLIDEVLCNK